MLSSVADSSTSKHFLLQCALPRWQEGAGSIREEEKGDASCRITSSAEPLVGRGPQSPAPAAQVWIHLWNKFFSWPPLEEGDLYY